MTTQLWLDILTPIIGPILTAIARKVAPKIPKSWIPVLAVVLGAAANLIATKTIGDGSPSPLLAGALGLAGIGTYELTKPITKGATAAVSALISGFLLLFVSPGYAADAPKIPAPPEAEVKYYKANEFSVDVFGGLRTSDFDTERSHAGVGMNYFLTENIGVGVATSWEDLNGQFFDNISVRGIYRIPIDKNCIYGFLGGQFLFDPDDWAANFGVGVERRWIPHLGTFLEIGMHKELTGDERAASATAKVGIRIPF